MLDLLPRSSLTAAYRCRLPEEGKNDRIARSEAGRRCLEGVHSILRVEDITTAMDHYLRVLGRRWTKNTGRQDTG